MIDNNYDCQKIKKTILLYHIRMQFSTFILGEHGEGTGLLSRCLPDIGKRQQRPGRIKKPE